MAAMTSTADQLKFALGLWNTDVLGGDHRIPKSHCIFQTQKGTQKVTSTVPPVSSDSELFTVFNCLFVFSDNYSLSDQLTSRTVRTFLFSFHIFSNKNELCWLTSPDLLPSVEGASSAVTPVQNGGGVASLPGVLVHAPVHAAADVHGTAAASPLLGTELSVLFVDCFWILVLPKNEKISSSTHGNRTRTPE